MLIFVALLYVCLASAVIWLVLFPSGRSAIARGLLGLRSRVEQRSQAWRQAGDRHAGMLRASMASDFRERLLGWGLLHPDFSQRLLLAFKIMKEKHGYDMALLEGYRSPARQDQLAKAGGHVTNARAFQSWHQYGLAADCAFLREGKLVISEKDPWAMRGYQLYGEVAESLGLTWGGRWTMMDFGHIELRMRGVMRP